MKPRVSPRRPLRRAITPIIPIGVVTSALLLGGCTPGASDGGASDGPVTLEVLEVTAAPEDQQGWRDYFDKFEKDNPEVTIDLSFVPIDEYPGVIRTRLLGGNPPDVFHLTVGRDSGYGVWDIAPTGALLPFDEDSAPVKNTPKATKALTEWEGQQYAWGNDLSGVFSFYNEDLYAEAGVEVPTTFDEVLEVCQAFQDKLGKPAFTLGGALTNAMFQIPFALGATTVTAEDPEWNAKRDEGEVAFADSEGWRAMFDEYVAMKDANCFQPDVVGTPFPDALQLFTNGDAGTMVVISVVRGALLSNPDLNVGAYVLPGSNDPDENKIGIQSTQGLAISSKTDHPEAAKALVDWAAQPENNTFYGETVGGIPIIDATNGDLPEGLELLGPYLEDPEKSVILAIEYWPAETAGGVLAVDAQSLFLDNGLTIEEALKNLDRSYDAALPSS